jgi:hypothetical protein
MKRPLLALLFFCFACAIAHGQSLARVNPAGPSAQQALASQALSSLKKLNDEVMVYRSLGEFQERRKLARVSLETFQSDLRQVSAEVEAITSRLPDGRLKTEIRNTLASYQDGMFWWQQIYQPRVVQVSSLTNTDEHRTLADSFLLANAPYTVAIYWRQANKYLQRAARLTETGA